MSLRRLEFMPRNFDYKCCSRIPSLESHYKVHPFHVLRSKIEQQRRAASLFQTELERNKMEDEKGRLEIDSIKKEVGKGTLHPLNHRGGGRHQKGGGLGYHHKEGGRLGYHHKEDG